MDDLNKKRQPFIEHLLELRSCLIRALVCWTIVSIIVYVYSDRVIEFFLDPLRPYLAEEHKVYFKTLPEVFANKLKLSVILGFILGSPYIIYQLWIFVAPGLYPHERRWVKIAFFLSSLSFLLGALTAYYLFLPFILNFLYSFGERFLTFKPYLGEYINFLLRLLLLFGILFQIPTLVYVLERVGIVELDQLKKFRPFAVILAFIISGILTTGIDPVNQLLLAIPLTALYEVGIILIKLDPFKRRLF